MSGKKIALCIGINYTQCPANVQLRGCVNDVWNVRSMLLEHMGYTEENIKIHTDLNPLTLRKTTAQGILNSLWKLTSRSWLENLEQVFVHYSGHGASVIDRQGEEIDGKDECLVPSDYQRAGVITDDTLRKIFKAFNPQTRVTCIFDCCHSGTIADLPNTWTFSYGSIRSISSTVKPVRAISPFLIVISGCQDAQTSADAYNVQAQNRFTGALSSCLLLALKENPEKYVRNLKELLERTNALLGEKHFTQVLCVSSSRLLEDFDKDRAWC